MRQSKRARTLLDQCLTSILKAWMAWDRYITWKLCYGEGWYEVWGGSWPRKSCDVKEEKRELHGGR